MVLLALAVYLVATISIQTVHVVGISMSPSLSNGDLVLASKLDYRVHDPERGDIVILKDPMDGSKDFIKRIIGLPGDRILIRNRQVFVNSHPLEEPYLSSAWVATPNWPDRATEPDGEVVPPATYFVLGDNRDHSSDSRLFGYISRDTIEGKAVVRIWPFDHATLLNTRPTLAKES